MHRHGDAHMTSDKQGTVLGAEDTEAKKIDTDFSLVELAFCQYFTHCICSTFC